MRNYNADEIYQMRLAVQRMNDSREYVEEQLRTNLMYGIDPEDLKKVSLECERKWLEGQGRRIENMKGKRFDSDFWEKARIKI